MSRQSSTAIAGLISVVILASVTSIGSSIQGLFNTIATTLAGGLGQGVSESPLHGFV